QAPGLRPADAMVKSGPAHCPFIWGTHGMRQSLGEPTRWAPVLATRFGGESRDSQGRGALMVAHVATVAFLGLEPRAVEVQVQISAGIPAFVVVGLPDKAVAESRERVRGALAAIGL